MKKLEFIKKSGFIIGIIVLLMAVVPMSGGLAVQAQDWLEFGDAPDGAWGTYPSYLASSGARHVFTETEILGLGSMGDWKNTEPDANVPDADPLDDGLVPPMTIIAAGNPAATVMFEVTDFVAGLPHLWVNILIDLNQDGDWADNVGGQSEHVVVNQAMPPGAGEWTFPSSTFSTVGATPGVTWLRLTLTRTPIGAGWDGTVLAPFTYGETEDHEILIESSDLPDLVVVEKWEEVEGCMYWVNYMVYNAGNGPAGSSTTCIYANGTQVATAPCPSLDPGDFYSDSVGPLACPGGTTVWIGVEADNYNDVIEENEDNNYYENLMYQPLEFGDAPDPTYPSLLASDGSRHCPTDTELLGLGYFGQDCKDFELDAQVIDNDTCCDGLVTTFIAANDPAATVTFEVTNFITIDNLLVNILIDLNIDGDWTDPGEHVVQNQPIPLPGPNEGTFVSMPFSTVGATPGQTWLRLTLTRTPVTVPWNGTGLFEYGETEDWNITIEEGFYWKPGNWTDYAPSGVPDFDQKQDNWFDPAGGAWTYCGPVAVANSLWYFDSREEPSPVPPPAQNDNYGLVTSYNPGGWDDHATQNVEPLVNDLAARMGTNPSTGTDVFAMEAGIRDYLNATGYNDSYYEHTEPMPDFGWIEEEVERCQDVILLLGFWTAYDDYMPPEEWWRVGGHYVTCAGVNSAGMQLGISDPFLDNAGAGGPGVVPVPHPYPHNASVHNDTQYVSHDIYNVTPSFTPGGWWALENYGAGNPAIANFQGLNPNPNSMLPVGPYLGAQYPLHVEIEYAVAVSPIAGVNATLEGHVDLKRKAGASWVTGLVVRFFDHGTNLEAGFSPKYATTDDDGNFTVTGVGVGTWDVGVKNWTCLSRMSCGENFTAGGTTTINFVGGNLVESDTDNDDRIKLIDFNRILNNFGAQPGDGGWDPNYDFDRSGKVDLVDFNLVLNNFGEDGDIYDYPPCP